MKPIFLRILLFAALLILHHCPQIAVAEEKEPEINDIIITTSDTNLLLFATVKNCFTPEMLTGVKNGLKVNFVYRIQLEKINNNWFDSTLAELSITHQLSYDSLKEQYKIELSENNSRMMVTSSENDAKQLMAELNGINVIPLSELQPDSPYALNIKTTLEKNTFPLGIHYVLPFTSLWDFETDWRTIEFRY